MNSRLERAERKLAESQALVAMGTAAALDVALPDATVVTAEHVVRWIRADVARDGDEELALREVTRLEPLLDRALVELREILASPEGHPHLPAPNVMDAVMRDGGWYVGKRPVFLIGLNQFDTEWLPDLLRLGGNLDTAGGGAAAFLMRNGPELEAADIDVLVANVRRRAELGIRSNVLFGHRMPKWITEEHPDILEVEGHFMFYDIDHPAARRLTCRTIEAVAASLRNEPGVTCYDLWNEAAFNRMSERGRQRFRNAMRGSTFALKA